MSSSPLITNSTAYGPQLEGRRTSPETKKNDVGAEHEGHGHGVEWVELGRIALVAMAAAAVWFRLWEPFPHVSVIGIAATLVGGYPLFKGAFGQDRHSDFRDSADPGSRFGQWLRRAADHSRCH